MRTFDAWKDSLKLCSAQAIKTFFLLTIKSVIDVIKLLSTVWVVVPAVLVLSLIWLFGSNILTLHALSLLSGIISFVTLIAARPSLMPKDSAYFKHNILRLLWFTLVTFFFALCLFVPLGGIVMLFAKLSSLLPVLSSLYALVGISFVSVFALLSVPFAALYDCAVLFYLDRQESVFRAFVRSFKMIWYNVPLFAVYFLLVMVASWLVFLLVGLALSFVTSFKVFDVIQYQTYMRNVLETGTMSIGALVFFKWMLLLATIKNLFMKCLTTNLYIKRVHDQYTLYFNEGPDES